MKRTIQIALLIVAALLVTSMAFAQEVPELRGTWRGPNQIQGLERAWEAKAAFVINQQNGPLLVGYKLWFDKDKVLQKESFVGIYDNGEIRFAEGKDGYGFGYLTGKETMIVNYLERGALAKAIRYELERVRFTVGFVEIDKDGSKTLIRSEIITRYPLNAERIMQEADSDKDGKLTEGEWEKWRKNHK